MLFDNRGRHMGSEERADDRPQVGSQVRIREGAFAGMTGQVVTIYPEEGYADVRIVVFNRPINITVHLDWLQTAPS
jgi:transcription antitermination factor NusG